MSYLGDFRLGDTFDHKFTTRQISGAPFTLAGSPVISAYVGNSTTQLTAGITLSVDFDTVTGLNNVRVVATSGNGYATASNYQLVITTGTVNSVSVVGEVIGSFSIENRSGLMPTVATRTLDVSATGEAGLDWANVGSPTTAQTLSGTTVGTATAVTGVSTGGITRASFAADTGLQSIRSATAQAGAATTITLDASASAVNDFYNGNSILTTGGTGSGQVRLITDYVGATKVATVDSAWATNPDATTTFAIFPSADGAADIADAVWDELLSGHAIAGSAGAALSAAGSGASAATIADAVWDEALSGHTVSGSAGERAGRIPNVAAGASGGLFIAGTNAATTITTSLTTTFTGNLTGSVGSVTGAVGSVTGNVGGNVTGSVGSVVGAVGSVTGAVASVTGNVGGNVAGSVGSVVGAVGSVTGAVGSVAAGGITASSIATGAIDADALAADASTELATAVLTAAASTPIAANIKEVNDVTIQGAGTSLDKWRPV